MRATLLLYVPLLASVAFGTPTGIQGPAASGVIAAKGDAAADGVLGGEAANPEAPCRGDLREPLKVAEAPAEFPDDIDIRDVLRDAEHQGVLPGDGGLHDQLSKYIETGQAILTVAVSDIASTRPWAVAPGGGIGPIAGDIGLIQHQKLKLLRVVVANAVKWLKALLASTPQSQYDGGPSFADPPKLPSMPLTRERILADLIDVIFAKSSPMFAAKEVLKIPRSVFCDTQAAECASHWKKFIDAYELLIFYVAEKLASNPEIVDFARAYRKAADAMTGRLDQLVKDGTFSDDAPGALSVPELEEVATSLKQVTIPSTHELVAPTEFVLMQLFRLVACLFDQACKHQFKWVAGREWYNKGSYTFPSAEEGRLVLSGIRESIADAITVPGEEPLEPLPDVPDTPVYAAVKSFFSEIHPTVFRTLVARLSLPFKGFAPPPYFGGGRDLFSSSDVMVGILERLVKVTRFVEAKINDAGVPYGDIAEALEEGKRVVLLVARCRAGCENADDMKAMSLLLSPTAESEFPLNVPHVMKPFGGSFPRMKSHSLNSFLPRSWF